MLPGILLLKKKLIRTYRLLKLQNPVNMFERVCCPVKRLAPLLHKGGGGRTFSDLTPFMAQSISRGRAFFDITALRVQSIKRGASFVI